MQTFKSSSTIKPIAVDKTSSQKFVYVNSNIQEISSGNPGTNEQDISYEYEVCKYSKEEYLRVEVEALHEMNLTLQLALIELSERR